MPAPVRSKTTPSDPPPVISTVIFDFGQTLFDWRGSDRTEREIAQGIAALRGLPVAEQERVGTVATGMWPGIIARAGYPLAELDLGKAMAEVFEAAGHPVPVRLMRLLIRREHRRWPAQRRIPAEVMDMLHDLRSLGVRVALLSNTIDPPENCRLDLKEAGLDGLLDASLFSTEVGMRKPNPGVYREMLRRLGNPDPATVLFVGDRILEDVTAPAAAGMPSALATWFRDDGPGAVRRLRRPADVVRLVAELNRPARAIA
jgi:putative hydrolase of the HAD superfamily